MAQTDRSSGHSRLRWLVVAIPYLWLIVLFLAPFLIVVKISLSTTAIAMPPYTPALDFTAGLGALWEQFKEFTFDNYEIGRAHV